MHPAFCPPQGSSSAPYLLHGTLCTFTLKQSLVLTLWAALLLLTSAGTESGGSLWLWNLSPTVPSLKHPLNVCRCLHGL